MHSIDLPINPSQGLDGWMGLDHDLSVDMILNMTKQCTTILTCEYQCSCHSLWPSFFLQPTTTTRHSAPSTSTTTSTQHNHNSTPQQAVPHQQVPPWWHDPNSIHEWQQAPMNGNKHPSPLSMNGDQHTEPLTTGIDKSPPSPSMNGDEGPQPPPAMAKRVPNNTINGRRRAPMSTHPVLYHPPHNPHGLHWIPLDSTGLHWTSLDFTI